MDALELLDRWKARHRIASDSEAAKRLGLTRQAVNNWRSGLSRPTPAAVEQMAKECGDDWRAAVLEVLAQQSKPDTARTLRRLAQTLAVCLVAVLGAITSSPALSNSARSNLTESGQAIHYAHYCMAEVEPPNWACQPESSANLTTGSR